MVYIICLGSRWWREDIFTAMLRWSVNKTGKFYKELSQRRDLGRQKVQDRRRLSFHCLQFDHFSNYVIHVCTLLLQLDR